MLLSDAAAGSYSGENVGSRPGTIASLPAIAPQGVSTECCWRSSLRRLTGQRRTPRVVVSPNRIDLYRYPWPRWHNTLNITPGRFFFIWIGVV